MVERSAFIPWRGLDDRCQFGNGTVPWPIRAEGWLVTNKSSGSETLFPEAYKRLAPKTAGLSGFKLGNTLIRGRHHLLDVCSLTLDW